MRVRFRLNEQRVAEMLRGIDPESLGSNFVTVTAGLLGCIGDIASLKFMPVFEGAPANLRAVRCGLRLAPFERLSP